MADAGVISNLRRIIRLSEVSRGRGNADRGRAFQPKPLADISGHRVRTCTWVMRDRPVAYCDLTVVRGASYCPHHYAAAHGRPPPEDRRMADQRLVSIVERLVHLEEERREKAEEIRDIKREAKGAGYNVQALMDIVKRRLEDDKQRQAREDREMARDLLLNALGDFATSPLGASAVAAA